MKIDNPIQMNDWEIKKFLRVVFSFQVALWGILGWKAVGLDAPAVRAVLGFICLTYVPGIVILRVIGLHGLGNIRTLLYGTGLSVSILMLIGLLLNTASEYLGVVRPITTELIVFSTSVFVLGFSGIAYLKDRDYAEPRCLDLGALFSPPVLFLCLLPVVAVIGVYSWDYLESDFAMMILVALVAVIVILIAWGKLIPARVYPLAIAVIGATLLFHTWLLSPFIWGRDIHLEYYYANLVLQESRWDPGIFSSSTNSMLGIVMLAPAYSLVLGMDLTWVFKIVYPVLCTLIPVGLFWVFRKQFDDRTAALSCFLFVSMGFYNVWLISAKQLVAELFLVLIIMLMMDDKLVGFKRSFLSIVFGFSLIVTHYGTSYVFLIVITIAWLILVIRKRDTTGWKERASLRLLGTAHQAVFKSRLENGAPRRIARANFLFLFFIVSFAWYEFMTKASAFHDVTGVSNLMARSMFTDFMNPSVAQGYGLLLLQPHTLFDQVLKDTFLATQFLIVVGIVALLVNRRKVGCQLEYSAFAVSSFAVMIFSIVMPYFSGAIYTPRLYNITLVFLAPLFMVGGLSLLGAVRSVARAQVTQVDRHRVTKVLSLLLVAFFLFDTGFAAELALGPPSSIPLGGERMMHSQDIKHRAYFYIDMNVFVEDVQGAEWLYYHSKPGSLIYNDSTASSLMSYGMSFPYPNHRLLANSTTTIAPGAYVYLCYANVVGGILWAYVPPYINAISEVGQIDSLLGDLDMVYSNGGNTVFFS